ncbi:hypothetical protein CROQUDRAFT_90246 [Cronartium quercuum f. sp. fusiforme G11]|uniref:Uncharacterized protein n=1 Tax=Cronartium quercuum f. sp. fusiforme G11 TaxID=708437 RepID=A0A9P6TF87_9BASI|nr:hypothetical protein CROQUDRAFT_90246 [Cronartium quercuum f. sp. fusiforme G11]
MKFFAIFIAFIIGTHAIIVVEKSQCDIDRVDKKPKLIQEHSERALDMFKKTKDGSTISYDKVDNRKNCFEAEVLTMSLEFKGYEKGYIDHMSLSASDLTVAKDALHKVLDQCAFRPGRLKFNMVTSDFRLKSATISVRDSESASC